MTKGKHEAPVDYRRSWIGFGVGLVMFGITLAIVTSIISLTTRTSGVGSMAPVGAATEPRTTITNSAPPIPGGANESHTSSPPPPVDRSLPRPPITTVTYTVVPGDNLTVIAEKFKAAGYQVLYQWNQTVIGQDPNLIRPGEVLIVSVSG